ncbi:MAG: AarF/ABC1/UbiB kinase family protein [Cyclobacteriaceae bacterium]|nr:AarF/ABC1/UbiB kinase family protein [Cyclobacteriaceae bacterium]
MKEYNNIPTSKVQRASKFLKTGAKIGGNYMRHYTRKIFDEQVDKTVLHEENAHDIYESLSHLKGGALKVAQMMSLDQGLLPKAYQQKFAMAQYSAPPLSYPLVVKTFKEQLKKAPLELFDSFTSKAVNAASIGQVHQATVNGQKMAVKVQYPGVAQSLKSDLQIVKPVARLLFNISDADIDYYMDEVQEKLIEETNYDLELQRGTEISKACNHLPNLVFPHYFPALSSNRIITMEWMDGFHLDHFLLKQPSQEIRNMIGQALWDFYDFQIHVLKKVHADAHPGNYLFRADGTVAVIDFGCVKEIPLDFYQQYFRIHDRDFATDPSKFEEWLYDLSFLNTSDTPKEKVLFQGLFREMVDLLGKPFHSDEFDFSDGDFFKKIYDLSERITSSKEVKNANAARGAKDGLYINRTYFGLYYILNKLEARIITKSYTFALAS